MTLREPPRKPRLAVIDGVGATAEVHLYATLDDDDLQELEWPVGWPSWVTWEFLESQGCYVTRA